VLHGFKPVITARYPLYDHEDNPLHENVTFFCHPSGAIQLKKEEHMPKVRNSGPPSRRDHLNLKNRLSHIMSLAVVAILCYLIFLITKKNRFITSLRPVGREKRCTVPA
jgi:hypothetical protein